MWMDGWINKNDVDRKNVNEMIIESIKMSLFIFNFLVIGAEQKISNNRMLKQWNR